MKSSGLQKKPLAQQMSARTKRHWRLQDSERREHWRITATYFPKN